MLSSPPRPSQEQSSHSSWVRHAKMDTVRTESTSSLSSLCFSLHHASPFPCPSSCICYDGSSAESQTSDSREAHIVLACTFIQEAQRLDIHRATSTLVLCLSDPQCTTSQRETLGPGTSRSRISSWQSLPVLIIFPFPPDNAHIFLPLFHSLHSLSSVSDRQKNSSWLGSWKERGEGWGGVKRGVMKMGSGQKEIKVKAYPPGSTFWHQRKGPDAAKE